MTLISIKSKQTYQYGNRKVDYLLIKSKRRKTSEVIVDKDEITIRAPFEKSLQEIEKILDDKISWILKKQKEYEHSSQEILIPTFLPDSTLPFLGKNYNIKIVSDKERRNHQNYVELIDNVLLFFVNTNDDFMGKEELKNKIKNLYNKWLNQKAKDLFIIKINTYSKIIEVYPPKKIILKNLKNRWGSVTKKDTINLNRNLIKAPDDVIDYIIIHELCHLKIQGHSHHFWSFLKQFVPDYEKKIDWLDKNSARLIS